MWNNKLFDFNIKQGLEALLLFILCNFRCFYIYFQKFTKRYHKTIALRSSLEDFFPTLGS